MSTSPTRAERIAHRPSGAAMNATYDVLRALDIDQLLDAYHRAPTHFGTDAPALYFFRWQVAVTVERKLEGRW